MENPSLFPLSDCSGRSVHPRTPLRAKWLLQLSLNCPSFAASETEAARLSSRSSRAVVPEPQVCPLSRVQAGAVVCIKRLSTAPDVTNRLRELGFCEEQRIKLLARQSTYICQVCNARLAISGKLADSIMVEARRLADGCRKA